MILQTDPAEDFAVYILSEDFREDEEIDRYTSLRWTDRYNEYTDFELVLEQLTFGEHTIEEGVYLGLAVRYSRSVMEVTTILEETNAEGVKTYTVSGRCLAQFMEDRVAWFGLGPKTYLKEETEEVISIVKQENGDYKEERKEQKVTVEENYVWTLTMPPADLCTYLWDNCVLRDPVWAVYGLELPYYSKTGLASLPQGDIQLPPDKIVHEQTEPRTVGAVVTETCQLWDMGFRLYRLDNLGKMHFEVYSGTDRTIAAGIDTPIVFSETENTLTEVRVLEESANHKDMAYVYGRSHAAVTSRYADYGLGFRDYPPLPNTPTAASSLSYVTYKGRYAAKVSPVTLNGTDGAYYNLASGGIVRVTHGERIGFSMYIAANNERPVRFEIEQVGPDMNTVVRTKYSPWIRPNGEWQSCSFGMVVDNDVTAIRPVIRRTLNVNTGWSYPQPATSDELYISDFRYAGLSTEPEANNEWKRRVLLVSDNEDISRDDKANTWLPSLGELSLLEHGDILDIDGNITWDAYTYGVDYNLGDLVELQTLRGLKAYLRVTEVTFVSDESGVQLLPGFQLLKVFGAETWSGWPEWLEWVNYDDNEPTHNQTGIETIPRSQTTWKTLDKINKEILWLSGIPHHQLPSTKAET